jgi:uncharacterized protein (TIGR03437 family)
MNASEDQPNDVAALYGSIVFNGSGGYTVTGTLVDVGQGELEPVGPATGTYSMGAGGFGFLSDPLQSGVQIRGMVSNGVFIGSSTEVGTGFNNLFVAALLPSPTPTAGSFSGTYNMAYMNFPLNQEGIEEGIGAEYFESAQFTLNPNGSGTAAQSAITGFYAGNGTTGTGQAASSLKYTASNGAIVVNFPTSSAATLVTGQEYLYFSPDGNFVFGGSPDQADMLIGVKNTSGNATLSNGLFYNAGVYSDASGSACDALDLVTYYGSFDVSAGTAIKHQRLFSSVCSGTYSSVLTDSNPSTDPTVTYTVGDGGNVRIGVGVPPFLGIDVALATTPLSGSGVYLNPTGVLNYGSYAPFTAGVSPGEIIALFGTNLAPGSASASAAEVQTQLPTMLDGVQVLIDGLKAPLYYVTPGQIVAIVPYASSTFPVVSIEVNNNGTPSNVVSEFVNVTTPGAPTYPTPNGISDVAALQYDSNGNASIVSESNPAQPGNLVAVYVAGLGSVFPPLTDGSVPNQNFTVATIAADISGTPVTLSYSGLSGFAGLYQLNFVVPTGLTAGDNFFDIAGPDAFSSEALIPIGNGTAAAARGAEPQKSKAPKGTKRKMPRPSQKPIVDKP